MACDAEKLRQLGYGVGAVSVLGTDMTEDVYGGLAKCLPPPG